MASVTKIIANFYRDSVSLMQLSARVAKLPGVREASAIMASESNLALLRGAGLLEGEVSAGPNDLLIALLGESGEALEAAAAEAETLLTESAAPARGSGVAAEPLRSLEMALQAEPSANLALISTPGEYAAAEAEKALNLGLNVMLFSDNVALADEVMLKEKAAAAGLLVMGPDCGTALIGGIPLGFANVVRRGEIGVVAASGTGLQQVSCLVDRLGKGISHAIGTGGHDLRAEVGGITMSRGIEALAADPATKVIVLISKPPAAAVAGRVLEIARSTGKPVVVNFLGADPAATGGGGLFAAETLEDAARAAVALADGRTPDGTAAASPASVARPAFASTQRYIRGLYSGGTFCYEASLLLSEELAPVFTNTPVGSARALEDVLDEPRPHGHRSGRRPLHARPAAPHDRPPAAQRAHPQGGGRSRDGRHPPRRGARLRLPCRSGGRDGTGGARGAERGGAGRAGARRGWLRLRHRGRPARPRAPGGGAEKRRHAPFREQRPGGAAGGPDGGRGAAALSTGARQREAAAVSLLAGKLRVVNLGLASFADAIAAAGGEVVQLAWVPPAGGDSAIGRQLARLVNHPLVEAANRKAYAAYLAAQPVLEGIAPARALVPGMGRRMILHAGPPIAWQRMCGPMRGAVIGAILFEGWAEDAAAAERLAASGKIAFAPCHHHGAVGPMAGIISPSMPVWAVRERTTGRLAFSNLNEGLGKALRFGANGPEVIQRLRWMAKSLARSLAAGLAELGPLELKPLMAQALHMGDEVHNRNSAATALFLKRLVPALLGARTGRSTVEEAVAFIAGNDHFFLNLSMAACKAMLDAACCVPASSMVTAMARNGVEFGIQLSGLGGRWLTAPAPLVDGLFFPGYTIADAAPDLGDSAIAETAGLGGFAMAAAPAIVRFVGGRSADAIANTLAMGHITLGRNEALTLPALDFAGTPAGIDARKVVDTGLLPIINTGIAHREAGIGQIGAGITRAPLACFTQAVAALAGQLDEGRAGDAG